MATNNSNNDRSRTLLLYTQTKKSPRVRVLDNIKKNREDLKHIFTECKPGFERDFWRARVSPLIFFIDGFLEYGSTTAFRCRTEVEGLILQIRRFKSVYGGIKIIYKILEEIRGLLRGYELLENPENPKSGVQTPKSRIVFI